MPATVVSESPGAILVSWLGRWECRSTQDETGTADCRQAQEPHTKAYLNEVYGLYDLTCRETSGK
jgi:hypothetical protein